MPEVFRSRRRTEKNSFRLLIRPSMTITPGMGGTATPPGEVTSWAKTMISGGMRGVWLRWRLGSSGGGNRTFSPPLGSGSPFRNTSGTEIDTGSLSMVSTIANSDTL